LLSIRFSIEGSEVAAFATLLAQQDLPVEADPQDWALTAARLREKRKPNTKRSFFMAMFIVLIKN
jgi:hypothetical protein